MALLLARFACNNHTICDEELRPLGVGLYPLGAAVNHSCRPNCMQGFRGSRIQFRALREILPGEEVTISYVELAATRQVRPLHTMLLPTTACGTAHSPPCHYSLVAPPPVTARYSLGAPPTHRHVATAWWHSPLLMPTNASNGG